MSKLVDGTEIKPFCKGGGDDKETHDKKGAEKEKGREEEKGSEEEKESSEEEKESRKEEKEGSEEEKEESRKKEKEIRRQSDGCLKGGPTGPFSYIPCFTLRLPGIYASPTAN